MRSAQLFRNGNAIRVFRSFWDTSRSQKLGRTSVSQKDQEDTQRDPYEGNFSFTECDQYTKVSVIGAAGRVGKTLSLLLKTCPLIDHLCLFDTDKAVKGVGVDISHIDTKCNVSCVCGMRNIQQALNAPDIVIIAAGCPATPQLNGKNLFEKNAPIIAGLSEACARFCPKACVILITSPINSLLPVVGSVYQIITNKIPSRKLFGLTTLDVVRANTFVAEVVRKDPNSVIVPVIGGTSQETLVPVISQMKPCCKIKHGETVALTECLKRAEDNLIDCQNCGTRGASSLSTAYAGFRFTTSLVMALKGAENVIECAFVKSDVIPELEYLASPLKLGLRGIDFNFGYPPLSDYELAGFEQSVAVLMKDIEMGKAFVDSIEETIHKGLIWKKLYEDRPANGESETSGKMRTSQEEREFRWRRKRTEARRKEDERLAKERDPEEEEHLERRPLAKEVYTEGVRNWAAQASFKRFFGSGGEMQENCGGITTDSISADLASDTCRDDPSLHGGKHLEVEEKGDDKRKIGAGDAVEGFFRKGGRKAQFRRSYHTVARSNPWRRNSRFFSDESQKMLIPIKEARRVAERRKRDDWKRFANSQIDSQRIKYKSLNAAAKQKYRSFNVQKKFLPSASFMLLIHRQKEKNLRNAERESEKKKPVEEKQKKQETTEDAEEQEEEEEEVEEEEKQEKPEEAEIEKQLMLRSERDDYRKIIFQQLRELRKENEELKKRMSKISGDKRLETVLQNESDHLELERTKLKACWLVMSSTMDAFSNFCKKFTGKKEMNRTSRKQKGNEADSEEENEEDNPEAEKNLTYDQKYFRFLQKLMEDQIESEMDVKRNQMKK